jgi:hypothetical protein
MKSFAQASHIEVDLDVGTSCPIAGEIDLVDVGFVQGTLPPNAYSLTLYQGTADSTCSQTGPGMTGSFQYTLADGGYVEECAPIVGATYVDAGLPYHHYTLIIDFSTLTWGVELDGALAATGAVPSTIAPNPFGLVVGIPYHSTLAVPCVARVDNVVVRASP